MVDTSGGWDTQDWCCTTREVDSGRIRARVAAPVSEISPIFLAYALIYVYCTAVIHIWRSLLTDVNLSAALIYPLLLPMQGEGRTRYFTARVLRFPLFWWVAQMGVIREALVERVQPDVAAAVREAIDVRNYRLLL